MLHGQPPQQRHEETPEDQLLAIINGDDSTHVHVTASTTFSRVHMSPSDDRSKDGERREKMLE
jgi:hypothetical protein